MFYRLCYLPVYVDRIISLLKYAGLGCHCANCYVGCIMYADDLLLMSSSVLELYKMLDLCSSEGSFLGINFNYKKSQCLATCPKYDINVSTLLLSGMPFCGPTKLNI